MFNSSKLTIIIPSYNKAKYIRDAFDSIFAQKTDYPYQIIVADDASTDGTIEIIEEYQKIYSNIVLLKSETNQGLYRNIIRAYNVCKTDYFCVLDPDDYWTGELFIQKALNFLEKNKDYAIYASNTLIKYKNGEGGRFLTCNKKDKCFNDFLKNISILGHTSGSIYRNVVFQNGLPEKMRNVLDKSCERSYRGDGFRNIIHLEKGKIHFVSDLESVYRITDEGIWTSLTAFEQMLLNVWLFINSYKYFDKKYPELLLIAYRIFNGLKCRQDSQEFLDKLDVQMQYKDAENYLLLNKELIEVSIPKVMNLKYRFFYSIYKKLHKKLLRKGFI